MTQLPQCFGFNLANTLAGDPEFLAHFFQRVLSPIFQSKSHLDDALFAGSKHIQNLLGHFFEIDVDDRISRRNDAAIFDAIAKVRIFLFADRRLERNRLLRALENLADLVNPADPEDLGFTR